MKTIVLHGSPRRGRDSDTLADQFLRGLAETGSSETVHFYTNAMNIRPCQGCLTCADASLMKCPVEDDMQMIYSAFRDADIVVFATPMYWGYMTAQLKAAVDRMEALVQWDHFSGKTFIVLITYHYHCASTVAFFERICKFFENRLFTVTCRTLDADTDKEIPISACTDTLAEVFDLGKNVGSAYS